jgi:ketosteroid isomerase-like protein
MNSLCRIGLAAESVVAARSGDLAYETGTWSMTMSDAKKKPATEKGSYVVVWQKQADGAWKAVRDVPVVGPKGEAGKK